MPDVRVEAGGASDCGVWLGFWLEGREGRHDDDGEFSPEKQSIDRALANKHVDASTIV